MFTQVGYCRFSCSFKVCLAVWVLTRESEWYDCGSRAGCLPRLWGSYIVIVTTGQTLRHRIFCWTKGTGLADHSRLGQASVIMKSIAQYMDRMLEEAQCQPQNYIDWPQYLHRPFDNFYARSFIEWLSGRKLVLWFQITAWWREWSLLRNALQQGFFDEGSFIWSSVSSVD